MVAWQRTCAETSTTVASPSIETDPSPVEDLCRDAERRDVAEKKKGDGRESSRRDFTRELRSSTLLIPEERSCVPHSRFQSPRSPSNLPRSFSSVPSDTWKGQWESSQTVECWKSWTDPWRALVFDHLPPELPLNATVHATVPVDSHWEARRCTRGSFRVP